MAPKLNICPFKSFAEANTYVTFVMLGMSIMMVVSAVTAAPSFITKYYSFATGVPDAVCEHPTFWDNVNTFYNVGTYVTQLCTEPLALAPVFRRIPLRVRMLVALFMPFMEMLLLVLVPVFKVPTQSGAIAVVMVVAVLGGFSKALCDSTTNALVGPFPTKFVNGELWGLSVASLAMSVLQCILKASMGESFNDVLWMSRLYFGIAIVFQVLTIVQFLLLFNNEFAHKYIAEFRLLKQKRYMDADKEDDESLSVRENQDDEPTAGEVQVAAESEQREAGDNSGVIELAPAKETPELVEEVDATQNAAVLRGHGDADKMVDRDQGGNLSSSDQMLNTNAVSVIKKVWPMLISCFFAYLLTMSLFPGVFFAVDRDGNWYSTIIVLLFSLGDFLSRIVLMIRPLRPSPVVCLVGCFSRIIVILPLALCVHGTIHGIWLPYILMFLVGITNGYFGAMSMIHCPRTPTLTTAGERSIANIVSGIFLQLGLAMGSNFAVVINLFI